MDKRPSNTSKATTSAKATDFDTLGVKTLLKYFLIWKILLLAIACASPGPGYDTSTEILFAQGEQPVASFAVRAVEHLALRLTRWDGIYFVSNSAYGHVNEQNWAFSWALARCTSFISRVFLSWLSVPVIVKSALVGVLISTLSHLVAVIALYHLTNKVVRSPETIKRKVAFAASCLHIISPAGMFLSAPYGESTFAAFSFAGALCYTLSIQARLQQEGNIPNQFRPEGKVMMIVVWTVLSGLCIGISTIMRSNGILGGLLFASDALNGIRQPAYLFQDRRAVVTFAATVCAGMLVGIGFAAPQVVAYMEYCTGGNTRPWCMKAIPSIYSWVQSHYWEVGFLRYWTLNNLPLFLLAAPTLAVMLYTGAVLCISQQVVLPQPDPTFSIKYEKHPSYNSALIEGQVYNHVMPRLAVQQLILAFMAATSFHVQIINRISSGYPVWYIVLASTMCDSSAPRSMKESQKSTRQPIRNSGASPKMGRFLKWVVRGMVMYAVVQGGLYACFLPPA